MTLRVPQSSHDRVERRGVGWILGVGARRLRDLERRSSIGPARVRIRAAGEEQANHICVAEHRRSEQGGLSIDWRDRVHPAAGGEGSFDAGAVTVTGGAEQPLVLIVESQPRHQDEPGRQRWNRQYEDRGPQDAAGAVETEKGLQ